MSKDELAAWCAGLSADSGELALLDDLVHDTAAARAADVNNGGPDSQITYLLSEGWTLDHIETMLRDA